MHAVVRLEGAAGRPGYTLKGLMLDIDGWPTCQLIQIEGPSGPFRAEVVRTYSEGYAEAFYSSGLANLFFRYTLAPALNQPFIVEPPSHYPFWGGAATLDEGIVSEFRENIKFLLERRISVSFEAPLDKKTHEVVFAERNR